ncbi:MAG: MlaD family protein [Acetobacteraceae bacterium]|nr:MlaD family protein [Acetobacteraceae bacterium]
MAGAQGTYFRVGLLILAAVGLGVGFVLFLTANRPGQESFIVETYLRESVTGLDVGAPVRFRGVAVGRVTQIAIANVEYRDAAFTRLRDEAALILIRFSLDSRRFGVQATEDNLRRLTQEGLRVRLAIQGVTGVSYLEMDFVDVQRFPPLQVAWRPAHPVLHPMPSTIAQVQTAAQNLMERLEGVPVEALLHDIASLVAELRNQVSPEGGASGLLGDARATLAAIRGAVEGAGVPEAVAELRRVAEELRRLIGSEELRGAVADVGRAAADLRGAIARLPAAIQGVEAAVRSARIATADTSAELAPLLRDLRVAAANLRDVTETLRRSPGQAILGAPPPPPGGR